MEKDQLLSVIIPAFNEERRIGKTLDHIRDYLTEKNINYELIVVDDCSTDNTPQIVRQLMTEDEHVIMLRNGRNRGKGYSIKRGMLNAKGDYLLYTDADLSTPVEEFDKFTEWLDKGYDIIIGSRVIKGANILIPQPPYRILMGVVFRTFRRLLMLYHIFDTQCGFKCYRREVAYEIFPRQRIKGFTFDVEILYIADKYNYRIKEVPIRWLDDTDSRVHPIKDSIKMLAGLLMIKWNSLRRFYER